MKPILSLGQILFWPRRILAQTSGLLRAAAAAALLLASPSLARAQSLIVDDIASMNSPYTFSNSATYVGVVVGFVGTGVLNHSAGTLTDTDNLNIGQGAGSSGTYNLSGTGVLLVTNANQPEFIGGSD